MNTPTVTPVPHGTLAFGHLLRTYRERLGLSKRQLARMLGKSVSTIARIEDGTMKPPRDAEFYQRLREVPGLTNEEVDELLQTDAVPPIFIAPGEAPEPYSHKITYGHNQATSVDVRVGGLLLTISLEASANPAIFTEAEVRAAMEIAKADVEWCIQDWLRRKTRLRDFFAEEA